MNSKERIIKTIKGEKTDRAPIWLRDQFNFGGKFELRNELVLDVLLLDEYADGWVNIDPNMRAVKEHYKRVGGDIIREFVVPGKVCNRLLCTPPSKITLVDEKFEKEDKISYFEIDTPKGKLKTVTKCTRNVSTMWNVKYLVEGEDDIEKLLSIPFELDDIDDTIYKKELNILGDDGIIMMQIDTPLITVSGLMEFEDFLIMCISDQAKLRELCDIAFERIMIIVETCLLKDMAVLYRINGSEQATPPMNSPEIYEKFVFPYEKMLVEKIHEYNKFAAVHSHGKVSKNLPLMIDMGLDVLDPIEPPPAGDLTFSDAVELSQNKITLAGNIDFSDLEHLAPEQIEEKVKEIFACNSDRIILNATAAPITFMSDQLRDNYITMIDAGIKWGTTL